MNYKWKILEVFADNDLITKVKYHLTGTEDDVSIETEGYFTFNNPIVKVPFADVTEEMIVSWVETESTIYGESLIKNNVEKQIKDLKLDKSVPSPWLPQIYQPGV